MKFIITLTLLALLLTLTASAQLGEIPHDGQHEEMIAQNLQQGEEGGQYHEQEEYIDPQDIQRHELLKKADENHDGIVSFEQHQKFFHTHIVQNKSKQWDDYVKDYYKYLDADQNEKVTMDEFIKLFEGVHEEEGEYYQSDDQEGYEEPYVGEDEEYQEYNEENHGEDL